jgi:hypothetical protein
LIGQTVRVDLIPQQRPSGAAFLEVLLGAQVIARDDRVREAIRVHVRRVRDLLDTGRYRGVDGNLVQLGTFVSAAIDADQQHPRTALVRRDE